MSAFFNNPIVIGVAIAVFSAFLNYLFKGVFYYFISASKNTFFHRSFSEQVEAVNWLRDSPDCVKNPFDLLVEKIKLRSFGLYPDMNLSRKIISFSSQCKTSDIYLIKCLLKFQGLYDVNNSTIIMHSFMRTFVTIVYFSIIFIFYKIEIHWVDHHKSIILPLTIVLFSMIISIIWTYLMICISNVSKISSKLNDYYVEDL